MPYQSDGRPTEAGSHVLGPPGVALATFSVGTLPDLINPKKTRLGAVAAPTVTPSRRNRSSSYMLARSIAVKASSAWFHQCAPRGRAVVPSSAVAVGAAGTRERHQK